MGIAGNEYADTAAKEAANGNPIELALPPSDYVPVIKKAIKDKWQRTWDNEGNNNKLKRIKSTVEEWKTSNNENRKAEVTMTRLRIGHTHVTHSHLMKMPHEPEPTCDLCGARQSVNHIMIDCPRTRRIRERYFGNRTLKEIIGEEPRTSIANVIKFLNEINLLNKI